MSFAGTLRSLRAERKLTQSRLAELLYVDRTTVAKWETGKRMPDAVLLSRISKLFGVDLEYLFLTVETDNEKPNVILLDDEKIILTGGLPVLEEVLPESAVVGFDKPSAALEYARNNRISLAFLDIELGKVSGLDVCRELLQINPFTNVVLLTAFADYAFDAWSTGACGFLLKPLTSEKVKNQLTLLRYPLG